MLPSLLIFRRKQCQTSSPCIIWYSSNALVLVAYTPIILWNFLLNPTLVTRIDVCAGGPRVDLTFESEREKSFPSPRFWLQKPFLICFSPDALNVCSHIRLSHCIQLNLWLVSNIEKSQILAFWAHKSASLVDCVLSALAINSKTYLLHCFLRLFRAWCAAIAIRSLIGVSTEASKNESKTGGASKFDAFQTVLSLHWPIFSGSAFKIFVWACVWISTA